MLGRGMYGNSAKMDLTEMVYEHVDWIYLAWDKCPLAGSREHVHQPLHCICIKRGTYWQCLCVIVGTAAVVLVLTARRQ